MKFTICVALVCTASATQFRSIPEVQDDCPFGYGTNCKEERPIDPATKAQVADILTGILKNLQGHKSLMGVSSKVTKVSAPVEKNIQSLLVKVAKDAKGPNDTCVTFGYGCPTSGRGGGYISPATKAQVANILKGIISNLSGKR